MDYFVAAEETIPSSCPLLFTVNMSVPEYNLLLDLLARSRQVRLKTGLYEAE